MIRSMELKQRMDGIRSRDTFREIPTASLGFKSGFVGIIGRPNVGKSTLMNQFVGQKIAITSPIAQTTRNRLRGIVTTEAVRLFSWILPAYINLTIDWERYL